MKETIIVLLEVNKFSGREDLERIEAMNFRSIQDIRDTINGVDCFRLTDFMDAFNDSDSDNSFIDISKNWIGYVNLIK
jgi:hypothetical protein